MDKSLYISMTGAVENLRAQTARANNLANSSTTGFKADFNQYRSMSVYGEVYPSRAYAMSERPATDLTQGYIQTTNNDLDVAIQGDGWFAVQTPDGQEAYTRNGEFRRDLEGMLVTSDGLPVLGDGGPIQLPEFETIVIGADGSISIKGVGDDPLGVALIDRLKLVNPDKMQLDKGEDGLFRLKGGDVADADANVRVLHGALEGSNVNPVNELTGVIAASRLFELNVKMMENAKNNDEVSARIMQR